MFVDENLFFSDAQQVLQDISVGLDAMEWESILPRFSKHWEMMDYLQSQETEDIYVESDSNHAYEEHFISRFNSFMEKFIEDMIGVEKKSKKWNSMVDKLLKMNNQQTYKISIVSRQKKSQQIKITFCQSDEVSLIDPKQMEVGTISILRNNILRNNINNQSIDKMFKCSFCWSKNPSFHFHKQGILLEVREKLLSLNVQKHYNNSTMMKHKHEYQLLIPQTEDQVQLNYSETELTKRWPISNESLKEKYLDKYKYMMQCGNYAVFQGNEDIVSDLNLIVKYKKIILPEIRVNAKKVIDLVKFRIEEPPYSDKLYAKLLQVTEKLQKVYQYQGSMRRAETEQANIDKLFLYYIQELEGKPRKQVPYLISEQGSDQKKTLSSVIAETEALFKPHWRRLMDQAEYLVEEFNLANEDKDHKYLEKIRRKRAYFETIYMQEVMDLSCIGCIPYFLMNWNVYDQTVNSHKLSLINQCRDLLTEGDLKRKTQTQILREICGFLNTRGGVILFDCERSYLNVIPRGDYLIKSEFKKIQKELRDLVCRIDPKLIIGKKVIIDFVPVAKDPLAEFDIKTRRAKPLSFFDSLLVVRITVRPSSQKDWFKYPVLEALNDAEAKNNQKYEVSFRQKSLFTTQKHLKWLPAESCPPKKEEQRSQINWIQELLNQPNSDFDHEECYKCETKRRIIHEEIPSGPARTQGLQVMYTNKTAMVAKEENIPEIRRRLRKYLTEFELMAPFVNLTLKGATATAILYHNVEFNELLSIISYNKQFQFQGKYVVIVSIPEMLKLSDRNDKRQFPQKSFKALTTWSNNQFKKEGMKLTLFSSKNQKSQTEIFIQAVNKDNRVHKACLLLLYLVLNHHGEKAILKNPKDMNHCVNINDSNKIKTPDISTAASQSEAQSAR